MKLLITVEGRALVVISYFNRLELLREVRCMLKLYSLCFNIKRAIKTIMSHNGSKTSGPDRINKKSRITEDRIIREVKLRLRRYKKVNSRKIKIPKGNGKY